MSQSISNSRSGVRKATPTKKGHSQQPPPPSSSSSDSINEISKGVLVSRLTSNSSSDISSVNRNSGISSLSSFNTNCAAFYKTNEENNDKYVYSHAEFTGEQMTEHRHIEDLIKKIVINEKWLKKWEIIQSVFVFSIYYGIQKNIQEELIPILRRHMIKARNVRYGMSTAVNRKILLATPYNFSAREHIEKDICSRHLISNKDNDKTLQDLFELTGTKSRDELAKKFHNNKDEVGGNFITQCYIMQKYDLGEAFVHEFPELGLVPYNDEFIFTADLNLRKESKKLRTLMPYANENILHMVIARRQIVHVHYLLKVYDKFRENKILSHGLATLLTQRTTGTFFSNHEKKFYFGSLPLHFAACANNTHVFDLLLHYASHCRPAPPDDINQLRCLGFNAIFARTECGDTLLHLCVLHNLQHMYTHIVMKALELTKEEVDRMYNHARGRNEKFITLYKDIVDFEVQSFKLKGKECPYPLPKVQNIYLPSLSADTAFVFRWKGFVVETILNDRFFFALNDKYLSPMTLAAKNLHEEGESDSDNRYDIFNYAVLDKIDDLKMSICYSQGETDQRHQPKISHYRKPDAKMTMLEYISTDRSSIKINHFSPYQVLWQFGQLIARRVSLEGLDIPYNPCRYGHKSEKIENECKSVISIICELEENPIYLQRGAPMLKAIIKMKWHTFGGVYLFKKFFASLAVSFSIIVIGFCFDRRDNFDYFHFHEDRSYGDFLLRSPIPILVLSSYVISFYYIVNYFMNNSKRGYWSNIWESLKISNLFKDSHYRNLALFERRASYIMVISFFIFCILRSGCLLVFEATLDNECDSVLVSHTINGPKSIFSFISDFGVAAQPLIYPLTFLDFLEKASLITCALAAFTNLFFSFLCFESTGPMVIVIFRVISKCFPIVIKFYSFLILAFSVLMIIVSKGLESEGCMYVFKIVYLLIKTSFDEDDKDVWKSLKESNFFLYESIDMLFTVTVKLLMLNLVIMMLNETYSDCSNNFEEIVLMERYNIMEGLEQRLRDRDIYNNVRRLYALPIPSSPLESDEKENELKATQFGFEFHELEPTWQKIGERDSKAHRPKYYIETPKNTRADRDVTPVKFVRVYGAGKSPRNKDEYHDLDPNLKIALDELIRERHTALDMEYEIKRKDVDENYKGQFSETKHKELNAKKVERDKFVDREQRNILKLSANTTDAAAGLTAIGNAVGPSLDPDFRFVEDSTKKNPDFRFIEDSTKKNPDFRFIEDNVINNTRITAPGPLSSPASRYADKINSSSPAISSSSSNLQRNSPYPSINIAGISNSASLSSKQITNSSGKRPRSPGK